MISIKIKNAKQIQNIIKLLPENLKAEAINVVDSEFKDAAKESRALAKLHSFTGNLVSGISSFRNGSSVIFQSKSPHAAYAEFGTRLGYRSRSGFEPFAARFRGSKSGRRSAWDRILSWMVFRGIDEGAWWPVYRKIMTEGTLPINNSEGYFIGPYLRAKSRTIKRLKGILKRVIK